MVLAICALGVSGSKEGYPTVEANEDARVTGCPLGVAIVNSCGLALRDLDFS